MPRYPRVKMDIFDKFRDFIDWSSLDAYQPGGNDGHIINACGPVVQLRTGATIDYVARIGCLIYWQRLFDAGKLVTIEFVIEEIQGLVSDTHFWLRFASGISAETDPPSEVQDHFGWKSVGGDLYASNADGLTQKITDTGVKLTADGLERTRLKMIINPESYCKFYVNDVLKVTHTENLLNATFAYLHMVVQTKVAATRFIRVGRVLIEKEHA